MSPVQRILVLDGNPNDDSYCRALGEAYQKGGKASGIEVRRIVVGHLSFDPNLGKGFKGGQALEPDLVKAQEDIAWSQHIVIVHPVWWSDLPAVLKGFIDRVFLPGFAFKYHSKGPFWDKLLKGRSGHVIYTQDSPGWYYRLFLGRPTVKSLKKGLLEFCGVSPVRVTAFGPIRNSTPEIRRTWLERVEEMGRRGI